MSITGRQPRLFIFDADGTLRWTTVPGQQYPLAADEWRLMPNVAERLSSVPWSENGPWLAVASNQTGVGEGRVDAALARSLIADAVKCALGALPPRFEIAMCVCEPGRECRRRKPNPGMLLDLLQRFAVEPADALYVGDLGIDERAADAAGVPFAWAHEFFAQVRK